MATTRVPPSAVPLERADPLRVLDITKFYSAQSGGVKTYLDAKIADFASRPIEHTVVVPGEAATERRVQRTLMCTIPGPVIPFATGYRLITSVEAVSMRFKKYDRKWSRWAAPFWFRTWCGEPCVGGAR